MNLTYKEEHEMFMYGHEGTTIEEISLVNLLAPVGVILRNCMHNWIRSSKTQLPIWLEFSVDFLCLVLLMLFAFTIFASQLEVMYTVVFFLIVSFVLLTEGLITTVNPYIRQNFNIYKLLDKIAIGKRVFIINSRAYVYVATAISILAVDFKIFPRRFCKAETYGTGLMDIGVGSYVLSNALVSTEARGKYFPSIRNVLITIKSTAPLWILGCIRLWSIKNIDYQEHVSEYGVHWNFFFTIAVVKIVASVVYVAATPKWSWILAVLLAGGYQYVLIGPLNLENFILDGSDGQGTRDGFINANREGLFSCIGYLALYFLGVQLGVYIFKPRYFLKDWLKVLLIFLVFCLLSWLLTIAVNESITPISRRLANLPFVLWIMQFNLLMLSGFLLADILDVCLKEAGLLFKDKAAIDDTSQGYRCQFSLHTAMNRNGLFYFLLSNVLTGAINIAVPTMHVAEPTAFTILVLYLMFLSVVVSVLYIKNISVKFW